MVLGSHLYTALVTLLLWPPNRKMPCRPTSVMVACSSPGGSLAAFFGHFHVFSSASCVSTQIHKGKTGAFMCPTPNSLCGLHLQRQMD